MREMCDGLIGSLTRGAPGVPKHFIDPKTKKNSSYIPYYKTPGASTWLKKQLIFKTTKQVSSNMLYEAEKVLTSSHIRSTNDLTVLQSWYRKDYKIFYCKMMADLAFADPENPDRLEVEQLEKFLISDAKYRLEIDKFFTYPLNPNITWFWVLDSYIVDILYFIQSEIHVINDVIPDFHQRFSLEDQLKLYKNTLNIHQDNFVKFIKYHKDCPLADVLKQELPNRPEGFKGHYLIWTGNVKQYLKNIINRRDLQKTSPLCLRLGNGFLQAIKRGCAVVPDSFVMQEIVSHVRAMVTPPTFKREYILIDSFSGKHINEIKKTNKNYLADRALGGYNEVVVLSDPIAEAFEKVCHIIMKPVNKEYKVKVHEPSHNASFERRRGDVNDGEHGSAYMGIVETLGLPWISKEVVAKGSIEVNHMYQEPDMENVLEYCRKRQPSRYEFLMEDSIFKEALNLPKRGVEIPQPLIGQTTVVPLCEPLKVRIITKGEQLPAYLAKTLQKTMKTYINGFPSMVLTTRPLQIEDFRTVWKLEKDIESRLGIDLKFTEHVSGDYRAATDKLNIGFTKLIFERFLDCLNIPQADRNIYRSVLYEQEIHYKTNVGELRSMEEFKKYNLSDDLNPEKIEEYKKLKKQHKIDWIKEHGKITNKEQADAMTRNGPPPLEKTFSVKQQNGQLMGSILSFPVLCLANLICYKCALDEYVNIDNTGPKRYVKVQDLPVLINGDDIYFRSNPIFYEIWRKYIKIAGFVLSQGKNYVHSNVFTINSQCFQYISKTDKIVEITYLNVGLLIGQSKSGSMGENLPVWDLYNKVLKGSYNKLDTHKRFLYFHKDSIAMVSKCGNYNLFLPRVLGGLGFIRPDPVIPVQITRFQSQLGTYFHNKIISMYKKPIEDFELSRSCLVDEHSPKTFDTFKGNDLFQSIKIGDDMPDGYVPENKVERERHTFVHTWGNFEPKTTFRSIETQTIKHFRSNSSKYRGDKCYFGAEAAISGNYPYMVIRSVVNDINSYQENLKDVVYKKVLNNIMEHGTYLRVKEILRPFESESVTGDS